MWALALAAALPAGYRPVVYVGPLLGQNLEVQNTNRGYCNKPDFTWTWIQSSGLDALCLVDDLKLRWDAEQERARSPPGVAVRPMPGLAGLEVGTGNSTVRGGGALWGAMLTPALVKLGYTPGETLVGHTYDWRLSVNDWSVLSFPVLQRQLEGIVNATGSQPVVTSLSMGGPYFHSFLQWADATLGAGWKQEHVHAFAPIVAPFNGAVMAAQGILSSALGTFAVTGACPGCVPAKPPAPGEQPPQDIGTWIKGQLLNKADAALTDLLRSLPSMYYMSPGPDAGGEDPPYITLTNGEPAEECLDAKVRVYCGADESSDGYDLLRGFDSSQCGACQWVSKLSSCPAGTALASTDAYLSNLCCKTYACHSRAFTSTEVPELFEYLGLGDAASLLRYAQRHATTTDPGVPVHCITSGNVQTPVHLNVSSDKDVSKALKKPLVIYDDGDGTVHKASLEVCARWPSTRKVYRFDGVLHSAMLNVDKVADLFVAIARDDQPYLAAWSTPPRASLRNSTGQPAAVSAQQLYRQDTIAVV